jgi:hypothetical protein
MGQSARTFESPIRRRVRSARMLSAALPLFLLAGCAPGVKWHAFAYDPRQPAAGRGSADRLALIYLRNWYDVACTRFEDQVLATKEAAEAAAGMYCIELNYDWDQKLAQAWGLYKTPASCSRPGPAKCRRRNSRRF